MVEDMFEFQDGEKPAPSGGKPRVPKRNVWISVIVGTALFIYDVFKTVATVLGVAFMIRFFLIQPFYVSGPSMLPTFEDNQYIIVDQVTYRFRQPDRGDVVVFKYPNNINVSFIKRVIALPGETIQVRDGRVYVFNSANPQGVLLEEDYLHTDTNIDTKRTLGRDEYFVMGDNRHDSSDSRSWGPVPRRLIVGKVWVVIYPFDDFHAVRPPAYGKGL